jgi:hypothetical protein
MANASLVSGLNNFPIGIAVSGGNLFVTNAGNGFSDTCSIGEYSATTGRMPGGKSTPPQRIVRIASPINA